MQSTMGVRALAVAVLSAVLVAGCAVEPPEGPRTTTTITTSPSDPATGPATAPQSSSSPSASASTGRKVYLALGDSLTAGYQRATGDNKGGAYPALLAAELEKDGLPLTVQNLACTGESTTDLVSGGRCQPPPGSQLREAERIAAQNVGRVALVTVFIGANDLLRCISTSSIDQACLDRGEAVYGENLPVVMSRLRTAVGPDVPIAVLTYYDPFRVTVAGMTPPADFRRLSAEGTERLNAAIRAAAGAIGATVVDLRGVIEGTDGQALCTMTSVCSNGDFHFNAASNAAVADLLHQQVAPLLHR